MTKEDGHVKLIDQFFQSNKLTHSKQKLADSKNIIKTIDGFWNNYRKNNGLYKKY
ncbi:hypothetical protein FC19_GL001387 [Liquorilactobacillus aquaticus DSM 21051]|uniref:Uncharacterized protein n=1 Tax=Liquorilactobacillus aquaticus DSM 21051 TaxID=1423725 RepID=A0A0R2D205_9LACO|nr:hypothetical protein FC19_GL001387 [Liquorilactobacillus aquaticus DSM 21051]